MSLNEPCNIYKVDLLSNGTDYAKKKRKLSNHQLNVTIATTGHFRIRMLSLNSTELCQIITVRCGLSVCVVIELFYFENIVTIQTLYIKII